jgi:hypothetical protein
MALGGSGPVRYGGWHQISDPMRRANLFTFTRPEQLKNGSHIMSSKNILVADYHPPRQKQLMALMEANYPNYNVWPLNTEPPLPPRETNIHILKEISKREYDLLIGHTGGNPSGAQCLQTFKKHNPKGRVIFYTKRDEIPLEEVEQLRQANKIIRRSNNDDILFDDPSKMIKAIDEVMEEPGIVFWKSPFKNPAVWIPLVTLLTAVVGLAAAVVQLYDKSG